MKKALLFIAIALAYYILAYLGLELASINVLTSPIWPASGLAIGMLAIWGRGYAAAIFLGSFLVNYFTGGSPTPAIFIGVGNALEALVASTILLRAGRIYRDNNYFEAIFIPLSAIIGAMISATVGNLTLIFFLGLAKEDFLLSWYTWFSGNLIGTLILAPVFLETVLSSGESKLKHGLLKSTVAAILIVSLIFIIFLYEYNEAWAWSFMAVLVASGLYFGRAFAKVLLILISIPVVILTVKGHGPFELGTFNNNLIFLQMLLFGYALAVYFIPALSSRYRISWKYITVIFFGWVSVQIAIYTLSNNEANRLIADFRSISDVSLYNLRQKELRYESLLYGAESYFKASSNITKDEWRKFVLNLRPSEYFDSIQAMVLIEKVEKNQLQAYLRKHKLKLRVLNPEFASKYNDHFIVRYIEPIESNANVLGLDVGSEVHRREAIELSQKSNRPVATKTIYLVQDEKNRKSFNLMKALENPQGEIIGSIHLPMMYENYFGKVFRRFDNLFTVQIKQDGELIFSIDPNSENRSHRNDFIVRRIRNIFGRNYEFEFYPTSQFFLNYAGQSSTLALFLNFFLLLTTALLIQQLTSGLRAEELVQERTRELETSKLQLMQTAKMASLGEMASSMAHEINNPLTIILGKLNIINLTLQDEKIKIPIVNEEIGKIKTNVDRIDRIIKGLKNFSRSSAKDPFELCSLKDIMAETLDLCLSSLRRDNIRLTIEEIPNVFISCKQGQISQVLVNLLNNSRDALEELSDKWIEVTFETIDEKFVRIIVTDAGTGISEDLADHIMSPFFTTKPRNKGTGLGLSISKNIVELHGGKIWVDSSHPHTRFVIELPIA